MPSEGTAESSRALGGVVPGTHLGYSDAKSEAQGAMYPPC